MPRFMLVLIPHINSFLDNKMSIFEEYWAFQINNITMCLDNDLNCSLCVDDFLICCSGGGRVVRRCCVSYITGASN